MEPHALVIAIVDYLSRWSVYKKIIVILNPCKSLMTVLNQTREVLIVKL